MARMLFATTRFKYARSGNSKTCVMINEGISSAEAQEGLMK